MKKRFLQKQNATPTFSYVNENQQYKRVKNNILLVLAIVGVCFIIRNNDKTFRMNDNTKEYIDVPSHTVEKAVQLLHIA